MKDRTDLKHELHCIYNHYKIKYKLYENLRIDYTDDICYNSATKIIDISFHKILQIKPDMIKRGFKFKNTRELMINILLHEICHAIDDKKGILSKEKRGVDWFLYNEDRDYHHSLSFEKRADEFAQKELRKWLK